MFHPENPKVPLASELKFQELDFFPTRNFTRFKVVNDSQF